MNRRDFLKCLGAGAAMLGGLGCARLSNTQTKRPNIVFILADDMGYADPACFGGDYTETPNLNALAEDGMRFTQFYSAAAVCSPTRASIMTGRYPIRFDIRKHFTDHEEHLPRGTITLPNVLRNAGYATAHIGKWHLGGLNQKHIDDRANSIPGPHEHGFEHYLTQLEDPAIRPILGRTRRMYRDGGRYLVRNDRNVPPDERHWTDIVGDEAVMLIERYHEQQRPFFINLWFLVPHTPYEPAPEPHLGRYEDTAEGDQLLFRSMVSHMDAKIGQVVAKLKELDIYKDTLIIFTSDNGPAWEGHPGSWKGGKTDLHEGGIRVPMIAVWPERIPPGTTTNTLGHSNDILPTCCAAACIDVPAEAKIDGLNLLPHMTSRAAIERGTVFWQMDLYKGFQRHEPKPKPYATEVVRSGKWKLLAKGGEGVALYDLATDPGESVNLLDKHASVVARLEEELRGWLAAPRKRWKETA